MGSLLSREPDMHVATLAELVGIAHAIEVESMRRYEFLAEEMERRGAADTAATFRILVKEERRHLDSIAGRARSLGQSIPTAAAFVWRLPADLATSWDDVAGSALLTPYRALALAVTNEQRAFAYYAYVAANATDRQVAMAAEELAREELQHAIRLRQLRRLAFHEERGRTARRPEAAVETLAGFRDRIRRLQEAAATEHARIAARLQSLGADDSAGLIAGFAADEARASGTSATPSAAGSDLPDDPSQLLYRAQAPLERLADLCEAIAATAASEELLAAAQTTLSEIITQLAALALQADRLDPDRSAPAA